MHETRTAALRRDAGQIAFGLDVDGYHSARLAYPDELYNELFSRLPPHPTLLEIGAGTGLVTEALLRRNPKAITAVEPDPALATFTASRLSDPRLTMIKAAFPQATIEGTFDLIACAAAFHWMEPVQSLVRVRELLAPHGMWAMWWHSYRNPGMGDQFADEISALLADVPLPPSMTLEQHYSLDEQMQRQLLSEAGFRSIEYRLYRAERELTKEGVLALYKSYSYVRLLAPDRRARLLEQISNVVEQRFGGRVPNLVLTPLYFATA